MCADDEKTKAAIEAKPIGAMHARFRLPDVNPAVVEKKKGLLKLLGCVVIRAD